MSKIVGIYILQKNGRSLFSKSLRKNIPKPELIGKFLSAIGSFAKEMTGGTVRTFEVGGMTFHFKDFRLFYVVIGADPIPTIDAMLEKIGLAFLQKYGEEIQESDISDKKFDSFEDQVQNVLNEFGVEDPDVKTPTKPLDALSVAMLSDSIRKSAFAALTLRKFTVEEIAEETERDIELERENLKILLKEGYIGLQKKNSQKIYFIG
ncbi:MAG: hypothetical protein ACFFDI_26170 [Promethearchaeota archaeon]